MRYLLPSIRWITYRATFRTFLALLSLALSAGCVERLLQVRSDPSGATVYVNGEEVGKTPCDHPFFFYGTVDVTLRAPGHVSHRELKALPPPWYQIFPLDLFFDLLFPFPIRDVHLMEVKLVPSPREIDPAGLRRLERTTEEMRSRLSPVPRAEENS